jgi:hypothetical protein
MTYRALLGRSITLMRICPAFLILGLVLAFSGAWSGAYLPLEWQSLFGFLGLIFWVWLYPRAVAAVVAGTAQIARLGEPLSLGALWAAGGAGSGRVRRLVVFLVLLGVLFGFGLSLAVLAPALRNSLTGVPSVAGITAAALAGVVVVIIGTVILQLTLIALILDRKTLYPALGAAAQLAGRNPRMTGALLLTSLALGLLTFGLGTAVEHLTGVTGLPTNQLSSEAPLTGAGLLLVLLRWVVFTLINAPVAAFELVLWTLFYLDRAPVAPREASAPAEEAPALPPGAGLPEGALTSAEAPPPLVPAGPAPPTGLPPRGHPAARRLLLGGGLVLLLGSLGMAGAAAATHAETGYATIQPGIVAIQPSIVEDMALRPDGRMAATCTGNSFQRDHNIRLWNLGGFATAPAAIWPQPAGCNVVAFAPDGRRLASGDNAGVVRLWSVATPGVATRPVYTSTSSIQALSWSPDGRTLAFVTQLDKTFLWDATRPEASPVALPDGNRVTEHLTFSHDSSLLVQSGGDLTIWNLAAQPPTSTNVLRSMQSLIRVATYSPDGGILATGETDLHFNTPVADRKPNENLQFVRLRDGAHPEKVLAEFPIAGPQYDDVNNLAFSPDGRLLAVAAGRLGIIDPGNRQGQVVYLAGHQGAVQAAAFTPDGKTLVSIGQFDGTILTWDVSGLAAR